MQPVITVDNGIQITSYRYESGTMEISFALREVIEGAGWITVANIRHNPDGPWRGSATGGVRWNSPSRTHAVKRALEYAQQHEKGLARFRA